MRSFDFIWHSCAMSSGGSCSKSLSANTLIRGVPEIYSYDDRMESFHHISIMFIILTLLSEKGNRMNAVDSF